MNAITRPFDDALPRYVVILDTGERLVTAAGWHGMRVTPGTTVELQFDRDGLVTRLTAAEPSEVSTETEPLIAILPS